MSMASTVKDVPRSVIQTTEGTYLQDGGGPTLFYNGEQVDVFNNRKIGDVFKKVMGNKGDKISKIDDLKTGFYTSKYYNNGDFTENNITIKKNDALDQRLQSLLNVSGGNLMKKMDIR